MYGKELILDIHNVNDFLLRKEVIEGYLIKLCDEILKMKRYGLHFWDDLDMPIEMRPTNIKTKGISAIQFIATSSIVIHGLTDLKKLFINIFSCEDFDEAEAECFTVCWFEGKLVKSTTVLRT